MDQSLELQVFVVTLCVGVFVFVCMASNSIEQAQALLQGAGDTSADAVATLNARRAELKREQREVAKEIHNKQRKRARLLEKARGLTDAELLTVVSTRAAVKAKAKAKSRVN